MLPIAGGLFSTGSMGSGLQITQGTFRRNTQRFSYWISSTKKDGGTLGLVECTVQPVLHTSLAVVPPFRTRPPKRQIHYDLILRVIIAFAGSPPNLVISFLHSFEPGSLIKPDIPVHIWRFPRSQESAVRHPIPKLHL